LLYAVRTRGDIAFTPELLALRDQGLRIEVFSQENGQRIDESVLAQYANAETTTYICGPDGMSRGLEKILHRLGVSKHAIITERFAY
jgi:ferredoxin-NADP reductase